MFSNACFVIILAVQDIKNTTLSCIIYSVPFCQQNPTISFILHTHMKGKKSLEKRQY